MTAPLCTLTMREIISITAQHFEVSVIELTSPRREDRIVKARNAAAYLIRELLPRSYPEIGRALGNRDHTTIMTACASAVEHMVATPEYADKVQAIYAYCQPARSLDVADNDPFEAAARILRSPREATGVSIETIRDLAAIAIAALQEATRQEASRASELAQRAAEAKPPAPPVNAEAEQLRVALKTANDEIARLSAQPMPLKAELEAFIAAEQRLGICSAAGERAARQHAEKARVALSIAAQKHLNPKRTVK